MTENSEQNINVVQDQTSATLCDMKVENDNGGMVGASLDILQADKKMIENDKKRIEQDKKQLQIDEEKLNDAQAKRDLDQTLVDLDEMQLKDDKNTFFIDLDLNESVCGPVITTEQPDINPNQTNSLKVELKDID